MRKEKSLDEQFDRGRGRIGGKKKGNGTEESGGGQGSGKEKKNQYATTKGQKIGQEKKMSE